MYITTKLLEAYKEKKYVVELNASTISYDDLIYLKNKGVSLSDIRISHNFFPKKGTGLSYETIIEKVREVGGGGSGGGPGRKIF